jgi:hypothetical protein
MADKRIVPDPLIYERQGDTTVLRPQASPVDSFIRPAEPTKSPLWDVAQALTEVNPKLNRFIEDKMYSDAKEEYRQAEAKAMVSQAKTYQEAIDKGEISPGQSPLYRRVFNETLGKNEAISSASATLTQKWYAPDNPIRNSQDPAAINKWLAEQTGDMLKGKSDDWVKGFIPQLTAVKQQLVQRWVAENVQNLEEENRNAFGVFQRNRILQLAKTATPEQIADALANDTIPQQFAGLKRADINKIQAQAIIDAATSTGNTNLLKVGYADRPDIKNPGSTIPGVFNIPGYAQRAQAAETAILSKAHVQESRALTAQAKADAKMLTELVGIEAINARNNPDYKTPDEVFNKIAMLPHGATTLAATITAAQKQPKMFDPMTVAPLAQRYADVTSPNSTATLEEKQRAVTDLIPFMSTPQQIVALQQSIQKTDGKDPPLLHSTIYQQGIQGLATLQDALIRKFDPALAGMAVRDARSKMMAFTLNYDVSNAGNINLSDFQKAFDTYSKKVIDEMHAQLDAGSNAPAPKPGSPQSARPTAPGQQTEAPKQQTSASIPVDRLVDVRPDAANHNWPTASTTDSDGRLVPVDWTLKQGAPIPDMTDINLLRSNPWQADKAGVPLWQRFEDVYGEGSVDFFMKNKSTQINTVLMRLQKSESNPAGKKALRDSRNQKQSDAQ